MKYRVGDMMEDRGKDVVLKRVCYKGYVASLLFCAGATIVLQSKTAYFFTAIYRTVYLLRLIINKYTNG